MGVKIPESYFSGDYWVDNVTYRFKCPRKGCNKGDLTFTITRENGTFRYMCHRCNLKGIRGLNLSPKEVSGYLDSKSVVHKDKIDVTVQLPDDFTNDIPDKGLVWLYKYGVTTADAKLYDFGYSPSMDRVILPVYDPAFDVTVPVSKVVYWQGRNLGEVTKNRPKYINVRTKRDGTFFYASACNGSKDLVIVEDILSAVKVAKSGYDAMALLTSTFSKEHQVPLKYESLDKVYVWLDPDKYKRGRQITGELKLLGLDAVAVFGTKDPKEYGTEFIVKRLEHKRRGGRLD